MGHGTSGTEGDNGIKGKCLGIVIFPKNVQLPDNFQLGNAFLKVVANKIKTFRSELGNFSQTTSPLRDSSRCEAEGQNHRKASAQALV